MLLERGGLGKPIRRGVCASGASALSSCAAQASKSAVSRVSQPAGCPATRSASACRTRPKPRSPADLEIGDTAGWESALPKPGANAAMGGGAAAGCRWIEETKFIHGWDGWTWIRTARSQCLGTARGGVGRDRFSSVFIGVSPWSRGASGWLRRGRIRRGKRVPAAGARRGSDLQRGVGQGSYGHRNGGKGMGTGRFLLHSFASILVPKRLWGLVQIQVATPRCPVGAPARLATRDSPYPR